MPQKPEVIIVGGSIGGLTAAAAAAPHAQKVTIYEQDPPPSATVVRRHAPQGAHIHTLLQGGLETLEALMPEFRQSLLEAGAAQIKAGTDQHVLEFGSWRPNHELPIVLLAQSRLLLEKLIHEKVSTISNVVILQGKVQNITYAEETVIAEINRSGETITHKADALVDASGLKGQFAKPLQGAPTEEIAQSESLAINIFYSTLFFQVPDEYIDQAENILLTPEPGVTDIGCSLISTEGNKWCISLHGRGEIKPPKSIDDWLRIVESFPDKKIWRRIQSAKIISKLSTFRKPNALWRLFQNFDDLPLNYFPLGDVVNSLNPIFGQGMSVAFGHAKVFGDLMKKYGRNFTSSQAHKEYIKEINLWTTFAWKKGQAYEKNFLLNEDDESGRTRIKLLKNFTLAKHKKIKDSKEFCAKVIRENQVILPD